MAVDRVQRAQDVLEPGTMFRMSLAYTMLSENIKRNRPRRDILLRDLMALRDNYPHTFLATSAKLLVSELEKGAWRKYVKK